MSIVEKIARVLFFPIYWMIDIRRELAMLRRIMAHSVLSKKALVETEEINIGDRDETDAPLRDMLQRQPFLEEFLNQ